MTLAINFHYRSLSQGPSLFLAGQKTVSRDKNDNTGQKTITRNKKQYHGTKNDIAGLFMSPSH